MKNILKLKYTILSLLAIALVFTACNDDLNEVPRDTTNLDSDQVLGADLNNYTSYLAKLYAGLAVSGPNGAGSSDIQGIDNGFGQYIRALFMMQEVPTDEAILGWVNDDGVIDMSAATFSPNNPFINAMYQRVAYQIVVCNDFLRRTTPELLESRGVSAEDRQTIETYRAEAKFLRALSYWHGLDVFGKMSFVTESDPIDSNFKPVEKGGQELFSYIETELVDCTNAMAPSNSLPYGRVDKVAAWMLLAKLYLNAEVYVGTDRYSDCLTALQNVLNSGYTFAQVPYTYMFMADNNSNGAQTEFIFPVLSDGVHLQSYGSTTFITHAAVAAGDENMPPSDYGIDGGWGGLRTRPEFVAKFSDSDSRGLFFTEGHNLDIGVMGDFTNGYAITKYTNLTSNGTPGSNATFVDTDFPMFRLTDAYLMYAECVAKGAGGSEAQALNYLNMIRQRAGATPAFNSLTLDEVYDERARELYWECHRRTDLRRQGKFTGGDYVWQWKGNLQQGTALNNNFGVMPIPLNVLLANPNLTQNTGY